MVGKKFKTFILFCLALVLMISSVWAGNKKMVEKKVKELDEINQKAVRQIPDLPENGSVDLKAKAFYKEGKINFEITNHKITEVKEKSLQLDKNKETEDPSETNSSLDKDKITAGTAKEKAKDDTENK